MSALRGHAGARRASRLGPGLLLCTLALGFAGLGTWQVERRAWKLALIDRVDARVHAAPVDAPGPARWATVDAAQDEYRHVRVVGVYLDAAETLVQASTELGAGFWVLTPLRRADGSLVIVNRGFVPPESRAPASHAAGASPRSVTGLLRPSEPGGGFLRRNDPAAGRWYSRDVAAIAAARGLARVAPYFIDADADTADSVSAAVGAEPASPVGGLTVIAFHNSHAVYAITWYTLALMTGWAAWRVGREHRSPHREGDDGADR